MGNVIVNDEYLSEIADAIRSKLGVQTTYKPSQMADAIMSISGNIQPPSQTISGLIVFKAKSKYDVGETIGTNDITCTCVYSDGTEEVVNGNVDASNADTSAVGTTYIAVSYGGLAVQIPITVYDANTDDNLLHLQDTSPVTSEGVTWYIQDNVLHLNGTATKTNNYIKITGVPEYSQADSTAWRSETTDFKQGNTYSYALFLINGTKVDGSPATVGSLKSSNGTTILSASTTPQTLSADGAYLRFYYAKNSVFTNAEIGIKIVNGSVTPTEWISESEDIVDNGITVTAGDINPTEPIEKTVSASRLTGISRDVNTVMQGIEYANGYLYCGVSENSGANATNYGLIKVDVSDWSIVATSSGYTLGHCNDITYCGKDGYLHCVSLDNLGTIYRVDTDLVYIDNYVVDLSEEYANYSGVGAITYDAENDEFVYLLRGANKGYAVFDSGHNLKNIYWVEAIQGTYGGILVDENYIYQVIYNPNKLEVYDKTSLRHIATVTVTSFSGEPETITWKNGKMLLNSSGATIYELTITKDEVITE